jgi:hypothetical protein
LTLSASGILQEALIAEQRMRAERHVARRLDEVDPVARLEPLPVAGDQRDERDWHLEQRVLLRKGT